jgi:Flp pilus assembly protein TadD
MIFLMMAAASLSPPQAPTAEAGPSLIRDASLALAAGRLEESKLIIARAVSQGVQGPEVDRLTADLAFASGNYSEAVAIYQRLARSPEKENGDCEKGALSALRTGGMEQARPLVECAVSTPHASWRAWNARGVLADWTGDWRVADRSYEEARRLSPDEAAILNNEGWSRLLRGDWRSAVGLLAQAAALDRTSKRIANNLDLAKSALAADLPSRQADESDAEWAVRLNDAGVAAELLGDRQRAIAAFTQALEASPTWYERASNNLEAVSKP